MSKPLIHTPGRTWAPSGKAAVDTLFNAGGTASGTYKRNADGVTFFALAGEPFAHLVANRHGEHFFVTCTKQGRRTYYMFGTSEAVERQLGIDQLSHSERNLLAKQIIDQIDLAKAA